jgi:hypothetical protein
MQQLSRKFYEQIIPNFVENINITKSSSHAKNQEKLYQYASGMIMQRDLKQIYLEAENNLYS